MRHEHWTRRATRRLAGAIRTTCSTSWHLHRTPIGATGLSLVCALALYGSWQLTHWGPRADQTVIGDILLIPALLTAIWATLWASHRCRAWPRLHRAWRLLGLALAVACAGIALQSVFDAVGVSSAPSIADIIELLFYPIAFIAVMAFPSPPRVGLARAQLGLDVAVIAIGGASVVIYLIVGPDAITGDHHPMLTAVSIAYPVGDLILLVAVASLLFRESPHSARWALRLLCIGIGTIAAADLIAGYLALHPGTRGGALANGISMLAIAITAMAAATQQTIREPERTSPPGPLVSWLPYFAMALGFGVLLYVDRHDRLYPDLTITLVTFALAILVSIRQLIGQLALTRAHDALRHHALHDALTGRPNRLLIMDRTEQLLARGRRERLPVAVMFIDVDGFKHINDVFGHAAGDVLLRAVADRLAHVVRRGDTVGRLGGDEFVVVLDHQDLTVTAEIVAERILEALRVPIEIPGPPARAITISASIGIATGLPHAADELLRDADTALYQAKRTGRNRYVRFRPEMHDAEESRLDIEMGLRSAVENDEFILVYQPVVALDSMRIVGVEALIRWDHPWRGVLLPDAFIPVAEQTGLIVPIGRWVLEEACRAIAECRSRGHRIGVAVNVSARQLDDTIILNDVRRALNASGLEPAALTLEITETAIMASLEHAAVTLAGLRALGVRVAIDDFGTGLSSLAYLRRLPIDAFKIDRSFIAGIADGGRSAAVVHTLIQLGKSVDVEIVAEGIESAAQLAFLQSERCELGQGFLLAHPIAIDDLEGSLEHGVVDARRGCRHVTCRVS